MKNVIEPQVIINTVCDVCEVKLSDVASKKRNRKYDISRQLIYFLLQTNTNLTYEDIGHMVGGRDVFTVMFGF
ncbi:MAG: hypothetical protein K6E13_03125 [Lachnospiraceae bacterium]|nr:hypothetical protein [Lachnospiraceae bacterium]